MLVNFLGFAPKLQETLQTPRWLADLLECSRSLKGPCHSDHMLVCKHGDMKPSLADQQLHSWDILGHPKSSRDTETLMQEQGKDQNGKEDIWHNSSDANG